ncbi:ribosome recycling factor [Candidatus Gracilibacteria bacterium]|nr:ribosome recycling factor [Candidatus Gracilibacteria bacterium]MCF7819418.1 ribosome recycling factor [Candidatus Gracilibacteria bacterium]
MNEELNQQLQKVVDHLRQEYSSLHVGRANVAMVDEIPVESYGSKMPLKTMANISCPDSKTIRIEPWDKSVLDNIEKGIRAADLGINPQNMGEYILMSVPPMTEERRKQLVKRVHEEAENARISVRNIRHEFLKKVKQQKEQKEISEDEANRQEKNIQEKIDAFNEKIDEISAKKENDVLSI